MSAIIAMCKDRNLDQTIQAFEHALRQLGLSWSLRPGMTQHGVYWVQLRLADMDELSVNGKGSSPRAALASALGEAIERLSTGQMFADFALDSRRRSSGLHPGESWLSTEQAMRTLELLYGDQVNVDPDALIDQRLPGTGTCWSHPWRTLNNTGDIQIPIALLENLQGSNGMASGNTHQEARIQALSEIAERHVRTRTLCQGICHPCLESQAWNNSPGGVLINRLSQSNGLHIRVRDASLGGQFPVVLVEVLDEMTGGIFWSFGAHPRFDVALERAATELLQGRNLQKLRESMQPLCALEYCADPANLESHFIDATGLIPYDSFREPADYPVKPIDLRAGRAAEEQHLLRAFASQGAGIHESWWHLTGVPVCRILIPGYSEIYPLEDLAEHPRSAGRHICAAWESSATISAADAARTIHFLESRAHFDPDVPVATLTGILPDPESFWHGMRLREWECILHLASGSIEKVQAELDWLCQAEAVSAPARLGFWRGLGAALHLGSNHSCLPELIGTAQHRRLQKFLHGGTFSDLQFEPLCGTRMLRIRSIWNLLGTSG